MDMMDLMLIIKVVFFTAVLLWSACALENIIWGHDWWLPRFLTRVFRLPEEYDDRVGRARK